ncbi:unnamed protein product [Diamesa hyperborea]
MDSEFVNSTFLTFIGKYVEDVNYSYWLYRTVYIPLLLTFLLPCVFVILIYFSSLTLYVFKLHRIVLLKEIRADDVNFWKVAIKFISAVWDSHATLYHGYEICGLEHMPKEGEAAIIVYYHGSIPIDMYYFVARIYLTYNRLIYTIGDRFLFKLPGWGIISQAMKVSPGTVKSCVEILKNGNILAISPGGVFEAQFGNSYYELMWQGRLGFAKVAIESKAPIIPMFTENLREGFRSIGIARNLFIKMYNFVRFPVRPIYGGFPVKFRTHLGQPILYEEGVTPQQLQEKVAAAIEDLIVQNQRIPGSIFQAFLDRFRKRRSPNLNHNISQQRKYINKEC